MKASRIAGLLVVAAGALLFHPLPVPAQERTLDELKAEILERGQKNAYPITEVKVDDGKSVLSQSAGR